MIEVQVDKVFVSVYVITETNTTAAKSCKQVPSALAFQDSVKHILFFFNNNFDKYEYIE